MSLLYFYYFLSKMTYQSKQTSWDSSSEKTITENYFSFFKVIFPFFFGIMHWASYFRGNHLLCGFFSIWKKQGDSGNNTAMGN